MITLNPERITATAQAVPFTERDALQAALYIAQRYTRDYLRGMLKVRKMARRNLREAIATGHLILANEHAALAHSVGVQAVLLIRRGARTAH